MCQFGHDADTYLVQIFWHCVNERDDDGWTPLHYLAWYSSSTKLAKRLLDSGADIDPQDSYGRTPIMLCIARGKQENKEELIQFLINNNADLKVKDNRGDDLLNYCKEERLTNIVKLLHQKGI